MVFEKNSAFSPLFLTTRKIGYDTYEVSPADVLLRGNITVMLHPEEELSTTTRLYNNSGSGWKLVNAEYIPAGNKFVARRQRQVGAYAVFKDDAAPVIRRWRTYSGGKAGAMAFSFSALDNFSGINPDEIIIFIDGERVIPEYDPEKQLVWYLPDESLYRGKYKIDIELRDRVGNSSRMTKHLTVK